MVLGLFLMNCWIVFRGVDCVVVRVWGCIVDREFSIGFNYLGGFSVIGGEREFERRGDLGTHETVEFS